jgi:ribosomal protein S11
MKAMKNKDNGLNFHEGKFYVTSLKNNGIRTTGDCVPNSISPASTSDKSWNNYA